MNEDITPKSAADVRRPLTHRTKLFSISAVEIAALFQTGNTIEVIKGLPPDSIVMSVQKSINQEAYSFSIHSEEFEEERALNMLENVLGLVEYTVINDKKYITTMSPYNRFQRLVLKMIRIPH